MSARYLVGDVRHVLATIPDNSVDLVFTSPPFLALRSYLPADHPDKAREIGSEPDPGAFIDTLLGITEDLARVLAPHGSLCVELGDTYSGSTMLGGDPIGGSWVATRTSANDNRARAGKSGWPDAKSACLIPELYRLSLAYGRNPLTGRETPRWRVRNTIRWCRPNPPVGALGDKFRPATSEIVVACKAKDRYFDLDAVRTPGTTKPQRRFSNEWGQRGGEKAIKYGDTYLSDEPTQFGNAIGAPPLDWWSVRYGEDVPEYDDGAAIEYLLSVIRELTEPDEPLDWWKIPTHGYPGAHYATFPPALVTIPLLSMCPERVCLTCGQPSRRIVEKTEVYAEFRRQVNDGRIAHASTLEAHLAQGDDPGGRVSGAGRDPNGVAVGSPGAIHRSGERYHTLGWSDCSHNTWRPGVVLDPFGGSGTVAEVATGNGRDAILIDIDSRNAELARERVGMFLTVELPEPEAVA